VHVYELLVCFGRGEYVPVIPAAALPEAMGSPAVGLYVEEAGKLAPLLALWAVPRGGAAGR